MLQDFRLKVFMTVVQEKNFTAAARELGISQPAVSQNIQELEKSVGRQLFERSRTSVALTPYGETFRIFASRIIKDYEDLDKVFSDYEAFVSISQKVGELQNDPAFELFKSILTPQK